MRMLFESMFVTGADVDALICSNSRLLMHIMFTWQVVDSECVSFINYNCSAGDDSQ